MILLVILCKLVAYFAREIWLDDRSTGIFVPKGPPSSFDARSTGIFLFWKVHPFHVMTGPTELFRSKRYALMTWWQVHQNFLLQKVHPHHVMTGPPNFFVSKGPPSLLDDRSMLRLCQTISQHLSVRFSRFAACFFRYEAFVAITGCLYP
jgi:hypothetical protein